MNEFRFTSKLWLAAIGAAIAGAAILGAAQGIRGEQRRLDGGSVRCTQCNAGWQWNAAKGICEQKQSGLMDDNEL